MSESATNKIAGIATVWLIDSRTVTDEQLAPLLSWLSISEIERYKRFMRPLRQRQFLIGRLLLRCVLARTLNIAVNSIVLTEQANNAPLLHIPNLTNTPEFSLSHTGNWIACAVSLSTQLGLDIEELNTSRDLHALSQQAFSADENAWLALQADDSKVAAFYQLWSRKEAHYKLTQSHALPHNDYCYTLPHPAISIVLCTEFELGELPKLETVDWVKLLP
ncbi:Phosphopantetheinyl transferase [Solimicrobium silvestre]|uniref:Phosphopantetheinyl transferase n=1 Tax=Solimicrobium silvestre TaxID=2099400 RepID=A0A2S9H5C7_9BURK|nr:Phosphopantetheinyl transferase [Solimicrobium silvestre]